MLPVRLEEKSIGTPHKDAYVEPVGNYRGIVLGCVVVKMFVRVLAGRLELFA